MIYSHVRGPFKPILNPIRYMPYRNRSRPITAPGTELGAEDTVCIVWSRNKAGTRTLEIMEQIAQGDQQRSKGGTKCTSDTGPQPPARRGLFFHHGPPARLGSLEHTRPAPLRLDYLHEGREVLLRPDLVFPAGVLVSET